MRTLATRLTLLLTALVSSTAVAQTLRYDVVGPGELDGHTGYLETATLGTQLIETRFLFEENGYLRLYAFEGASDDSFTVVPSVAYIVKMDTLSVGEEWASYWDGATIATVVSTEVLSVPAGDFDTYVVDHERSSGSFVGRVWFARGVGSVASRFGPHEWRLADFTVGDDPVFYPLAAGNAWEYDLAQVTGVPPEDDIGPWLGALPNPWRRGASIRYELVDPARVRVRVFDVRGRLVQTLVDRHETPGVRYAPWRPESDGVYFVRLETAKRSATRKVVVLDD